MTVVSESSTSPCRVIIKSFLFMKQIYYLNLNFETLFRIFERKWTEDEYIRGSSNNN